MYIFTPDGKKLRSNSEIEQFVEDHPDVKCDMEVTNTFKIQSFAILSKLMFYQKQRISIKQAAFKQNTYVCNRKTS